MPFSGPPPDLPSWMVDKDIEALDAPSRTREERERWSAIREGIHHRITAHRAIEEARRASILMWAALLLCVPAFVVGGVVVMLMMQAVAKGMNQAYNTVGLAMALGMVCAVWTESALLALVTVKRLVALVVERFGKGLWE